MWLHDFWCFVSPKLYSPACIRLSHLPLSESKCCGWGNAGFLFRGVAFALTVIEMCEQDFGGTFLCRTVFHDILFLFISAQMETEGFAFYSLFLWFGAMELFCVSTSCKTRENCRICFQLGKWRLTQNINGIPPHVLFLVTLFHTMLVFLGGLCISW